MKMQDRATGTTAKWDFHTNITRPKQTKLIH